MKSTAERPLRVHVVALDYDGTIARDGVLDPHVRDAIGNARAAGIAVVLVTGRIRADLERLLPDPWLFDAIVAENGAVVQFPSRDRSLRLAPAPPRRFLDELRYREVPFLAGECIVEFDADRAGVVLDAIRDLELPLVIAFNRSRAMALPQSISKSTGLREALRAMRLSPHDAAAIGDAENDHEMLAACECGIAVAWGSDALCAAADDVLPGDGPAAVAGLLAEADDGVLRLPRVDRKRRVHVGVCTGGDSLDLIVRDRNLLVAGESQSGKSWVAGLICEQLILQHYCVCVIDPEGEYGTLESLPSVVVFDGDPSPPQIDDVERTLRYPDVSVVLDLSAMEHEAKQTYTRALLQRLRDLRRKTGLPHHIVVDEAHYFLNELDGFDAVDLDDGGYVFVSYLASQIHESVLRRLDGILVTRASASREIEALRELCGSATDERAWRETLANLRKHDAALLPGPGRRNGLVPFRVSKRLTHHVRHREKYLHVPVAHGREFVFMRAGRPTGQRARTLLEFREVLAQSEAFADHLDRQDFSRWILQVLSDAELAASVRKIEVAWSTEHDADVHARIDQAIRTRYENEA